MPCFEVTARLVALWLILAMGAACGQALDRKITVEVPAGLAVPRVSELRAPIPSGPTNLRIVFEVGVVSNAYWLIDTCAHAAQPAKDEACAPLRPSLDEAGFQALAKWRWIKQSWLRANRPAETELSPAQRLFVDALGAAVPSASERFALAFLDSADADQVSASLGLAPAEAAELGRVLAHFQSDVQAVVTRDASFLPRAQSTLSELAARGDLAAHVHQAARFYGVDAQLPDSFQVDLLWNPSTRISATVHGNHMLLPVSEAHLEEPRRMQALVGVAMHELGHALAARVGDNERQRIGERMVFGTGLSQLSHRNIFDEATQVALANVLFMNRAFPGALRESDVLYEYEPNNPYPYAIDLYARHLSGVLARHMQAPGAFARDYLTEAAQIHEQLFGNVPRAYGSVGLALSDQASLLNVMSNLFGVVSREDFGKADWSEFAQRSVQLPAISRWVLLTGDLDAKARAPIVSLVPAVAMATAAVRGQRVCAVAQRRGPNAGYDIAVVGTEAADVRDMLVNLHRRSDMPLTPMCH